VGAGKLKRLKQGLQACILLGLIYSILACVVLSLFGSKIALLFVNGSEREILKQTQTYLMVNSIFYFPLALVNIIRFTIQGMGYSMLAVLAGVSEMVARSLVGFVFVPMFGYIAVCFASPVAWIFADIFLIPAFYYSLHSLKREMKII
jgi:Na+-driven multidrug efflux pump